jgi:hypothetical protein
MTASKKWIFENVIRQRAHAAGYRMGKSGSQHGDYTLTRGGYVVISPVSLEEIEEFLSLREQLPYGLTPEWLESLQPKAKQVRS